MIFSISGRKQAQYVNPGLNKFDAYLIHQQKDATLNALIISLLSVVLSLTTVHYTYHAVGHPILKTLLSPTYIRRLNSYIGGLNNELILVSLKLYNISSTFAGGRERKAVLDAFPWELKVRVIYLHVNALLTLCRLYRSCSTCDVGASLRKPTHSQDRVKNHIMLVIRSLM
jgi:hypothetical protein